MHVNYSLYSSNLKKELFWVFFVNVMDIFDEILLEDDLDILDVIDMGFPRRIYDRAEHFNGLDNFIFFKRFRLLKPTVLNILELIEEDLEFPNDLNNSVSPMNQLLTTLRFYASSGHLAAVADYMGIHESTASRIVCRVSAALARLYPQFVKLPTAQEFIRVHTGFFNIARFPRVLGIVDCTHIRITSPGGDDPEVFRNRKGYFSVNTQAVTDSNLKFINVVARWPGSSHDNTIFLNSRIRRKFETNHFPNSILLGDRGYAQRNYLLTPLARPVHRAEALYNESLIRTRNSVERVFGIWKRRFPVLAYGLRLKLDTVLSIIPAAAVLHNIAREMHEPEPPIPGDINEDELNYLIEEGQMPDVPIAQGPMVFQNQLIEEYFANL